MPRVVKLRSDAKRESLRGSLLCDGKLCPRPVSNVLPPILSAHATRGAPYVRGRLTRYHSSSQDGEHTFQLRLRFPFFADGARIPVASLNKPLEMTVKTILSALVALSFVAGAVAPASAEPFSIKTLDQDRRGGHAG